MKRDHLFAFVAFLAALAAVPLVGDYAMGIVAEILVFSVFAMSLGLLIGYVGLMSFGHAAFFGISTYTVIILGVHLGISGWWGMLAGVAVATVAAALIGMFCIRVSGIPFLMLTMAFSQLLFSLALKWRDVTGGTDGLTGFVRPSLLGLSLNRTEVRYGVVAVGFVMVLAFLWLLVRSPLGSIFIGIRDNEVRMRALGYPVQKMKLVAFTIAGGLAGIGGALYALLNGFVSTDLLHWALSGDAIIMVVLGGAGTVIGPVVGTAIFLLLKNFLSSQSHYWMIWVGSVFILCVMFMREGAWGFVLQRTRQWKERKP